MAHQATQEFLNWIDKLPEQEKIYALLKLRIIENAV